MPNHVGYLVTGIHSPRVNPEVNRFVIEASIIAQKREPGQFVVFRLHEKGERIPITIADADAQAGTITVYVQELGKTTFQMGRMNAGDEIADVIGPLVGKFTKERRWVLT